MANEAWKSDSEGYFLEMAQGAKKDYSIDWIDFIPTDTLSALELTVAAGVTQVGNTEINGKVSKFILHANGAKGLYACSAKMTPGTGVPIEVIPFRVVVR